METLLRYWITVVHPRYRYSLNSIPYRSDEVIFLGIDQFLLCTSTLSQMGYFIVLRRLTNDLFVQKHHDWSLDCSFWIISEQPV